MLLWKVKGNATALLFSEQFLKKQTNENTDSWKHTFFQINQVVYIKDKQFLVCQLHLNEVLKKERNNQPTNLNNYYWDSLTTFPGWQISVTEVK